MTMASAKTPSSKDEDLFFRLPDDRKWNACIGRQGTEENYVDGYIEAAIELATAVIEKKMLGKRDTLVMPILYNGRHALELALKFTIRKLHEMGVIKTTHPVNHDIMSQWEFLNSHELGDRALRECVLLLGPFIESLARIDEDGQELRYPENREGKKSLADRSLANIEVIQTALRQMARIMAQLQARLTDFGRERATGSYTTKCSRRDLIEIAHLLPAASEWRRPVYDEARMLLMERFGLSRSEFIRAADIVQTNREMRLAVGLSTELVHLTDDKAQLVFDQWVRLHPRRTGGGVGGIVMVSDFSLESIEEDLRLGQEVAETVLQHLTPNQVADLEAIYYIGRDQIFCERYESFVDSICARQRVENRLAADVDHLMQKTNLLREFARGVTTLGRPDLGKSLLQSSS